MKKLNALIYAILLAISANVWADGVDGFYAGLEGGASVSSANTATPLTLTTTQTVRTDNISIVQTFVGENNSFTLTTTFKDTPVYTQKSVSETVITHQKTTVANATAGAFALYGEEVVKGLYLGGEVKVYGVPSALNNVAGEVLFTPGVVPTNNLSLNFLYGGHFAGQSSDTLGGEVRYFFDGELFGRGLLKVGYENQSGNNIATIGLAANF